MNSTQIQTFLAPIIAAIAAWLARKIPFLDAASIINLIDSCIVLATSSFMAYINRNKAIIAQAVALPEVKTIVASPEAAAASPSPDVVSSATSVVVNK